MLYSRLFGKTVKTVPSDATLVSHRLLYKAGFIRESTAGRYFILPLGERVQQKITGIIKEEMDKAGAQEMLAPVLHPISLWQETNRDKSTGYELMTVKDRAGASFALGGTAEEMFVDVIRKFQLSYKDLPLNIYQFSTKFRDELRARGGLLRVREFLMKDAYSFDRNEEEFKKTYDLMKKTYTKIFQRIGFKTIIVESDNGYIGGDYCHEYCVESEAGESTFYMSQDATYAAHEEVVKKPKNELVKKTGIEVGNIFQLGYYYSKKMKGATFVDKDGREKNYYMGCYGIGIGRTMAAAVEISHDDKGIIWPETIAPYQVQLIGLDLSDGQINDKCHKIYSKLLDHKAEVLFDDRQESPGTKFSDADLIGIPLRLVVSKRTGDKIEVKKRTEQKSELMDLEDVLRLIRL